MPDWCQTTLVIAGDKTNILRFTEAASGVVEYDDGSIALRPLSLEGLYPAPAEVHGTDSWNGWCTEHWGTKWDVRVIDSDIQPDAALYELDSAWSPPLNAFVKISADYPDLVFYLTYHDLAVGIGGCVILEAGVAITGTEWAEGEDEDEDESD